MLYISLHSHLQALKTYMYVFVSNLYQIWLLLWDKAEKKEADKGWQRMWNHLQNERLTQMPLCSRKTYKAKSQRRCCQGAMKAQLRADCRRQWANTPGGVKGFWFSKKLCLLLSEHKYSLCNKRTSRLGIPIRGRLFPQDSIRQTGFRPKHKGILGAEPEITEMKARLLFSTKGGGLNWRVFKLL